MISIIYHNPQCSKSREALALVSDSGDEVHIIEYLKFPPTVHQLRDVLDKLGMKASEIVRRTESIYLDQYANTEFSDEEWLNILTTHPRLIQRPIIIRGNKAVIGRPPESISILYND